MSKMRVALALGMAMAFTAIAYAQSFSLRGTWNGHYAYADGQRQVQFALELDSSPDGRCVGRTTEPNTIGEKSATHLYGNVSCLSRGVGPGGGVSLPQAV